MSADRRLAAILVADVVGSSRLIEADETYALTAIREVLHEKLAPAAVQHGGRLVKTLGDGALIEFASAVEAVTCADRVQSTVAARFDSEPAERRIQLRIGINLGDVVATPDGDLHGDGINIAARLEAICEPGGIAISSTVHDHLAGRLNLTWMDRGEVTLRNVSRPVHVWARAAANAPALKVASPPVPPPDKPSIAVLPFAYLSGVAEQDYFADGLVDEIIMSLSRIRSFFVIARNSSFTYKGKVVDVRQVGQELGVQYVLEGSVRRAGGRVRITGQLIEAETGRHVWTDRFDGDLSDVFELQENVAARVASAIEPTLRTAEIERIARKHPSSLSAYDLFLRSVPEMQKYSREGYLAAESFLTRALEIDDHYGHAWAALAECLGRQVLGGWAANIVDVQSRVSEACAKAVAYDPDSAWSLANAAWCHVVILGNLERAVDLARKAVQLNPNSAQVLSQSGIAFIYSGEVAVALDCFEKANRISPIDPRSYTISIGLAQCNFFLGRYDEAVTWAAKAKVQAPMFAVAHRWLAASLAAAGRLPEAKTAAAELVAVLPTQTKELTRRENAIYRKSEMLDALLRALQAAGVPEGR